MKSHCDNKLVLATLIVFCIYSETTAGYIYDLSVGYGKLAEDGTTSYRLRAGKHITDNFVVSLGASQNSVEYIDTDFYSYFADVSYQHDIADDFVMSYGLGANYGNDNIYPSINLKVNNTLSDQVGLFLESRAFLGSGESSSDLGYLVGAGVSWSYKNYQAPQHSASRPVEVVNVISENKSIDSQKETKPKLVSGNVVQLNKDIELINIFDINSSYIGKFDQLDKIAQELSENNDLFVTIININSYEGSAEYNAWLAEKRGATLVAYFQAKGVSLEQFEFINQWGEGINKKYRQLLMRYKLIE